MAMCLRNRGRSLRKTACRRHYLAGIVVFNNFPDLRGTVHGDCYWNSALVHRHPARRAVRDLTLRLFQRATWINGGQAEELVRTAAFDLHPGETELFGRD